MSVEEIEKRVDRAIAGAVVVSTEIGGVKFASMIEVMEFAKLMAVSGAAVPQHLRANPGACLGIVVQALEWRMSPFAVANKSYIANDRIAYESQLIHAIVEARAPLKGRLRHEILGEGDERRCKVWGTFFGEATPHSYTSETLASLRDARGKNDRGQVRGSPLWQAQPEVQLFYSASRTWARINCPDVILGIYTKDEMDEVDDKPVAVDVKLAELQERLSAAKLNAVKGRGFDAEHVNRTAASVIEGEVNPDAPKEEAVNVADAQGSGDEPGPEGRGGRAASAADSPADQAGGADVLSAGGEDGGEPVGHKAEEAQGGEGDSPGKPAPKKGRGK